MSAVVYHAGLVDPAVVRRFVNAMQNAIQSLAKKKLMALMHAVGFERVPADYDEQFTACAQAYHQPGVLKEFGLIK